MESSLITQGLKVSRIRRTLEASGVLTNLDEISNQLSIGPQTSIETTSSALEAATSTISLDLLRKMMLDELELFSHDDVYLPSVMPIESDIANGISIFKDDNLSLSALCWNPIPLKLKKNKNAKGRKTISVNGEDISMRFLQSGSCVIEIWDTKPFERNEPLEQRMLPNSKLIRVEDGDTLTLEGGRHAISIKSSDHPVIIISASTASTRTSVNAHYLEETGNLHSFTASEMRSSRIQSLSFLLCQLRYTRGAETIETLLNHPDHFVRWSLMRDLLALDSDRGILRLIEMSERDAHPQVREAARNSVKAMEKK